MTSNYSNIRYHIYRELAKYHQNKKEEWATLIDDISIPIFSGVVSPCIANYFKNCYPNPVAFIFAILLSFFLIIAILKIVVRFYRNFVRPYIFPIKDQSLSAQAKEAEGLATKYNYEVIYLVSLAYKKIKRRIKIIF